MDRDSFMIVVALTLGVLATMGWAIARWARWVSGRYGAPRWTRYVVWPIAGGWLVGVLGTAHGLLAVFRSAQNASEQRRIVAEGISEAFNCSALVVVWSCASAVFLFALTWRYEWAAKAPRPRGEPPYR